MNSTDSFERSAPELCYAYAVAQGPTDQHKDLVLFITYSTD